jgi:hemolysin activation/secretion protein
LFGRDDGFYYRSLGAELSGTRRSADEGSVVTWRLFGEQQDSAPVRTHRSLANTLNGNRFTPNIQARAGMYWGGSAGMGYAWGTDPSGTRLSGGSRVEAATGEANFARFSTEISASRGLGRGAQGSLTASGGTSVGSVPVQRLWYLGGAHTVRGHAPGAVVGDAYWFGRAELAMGHPLVRPSLFADIGWAGDRAKWSQPGTPLSGGGLGAALLDGLVRLDVARGLERGGGWRVDFYLEVR